MSWSHSSFQHEEHAVPNEDTEQQRPLVRSHHTHISGSDALISLPKSHFRLLIGYTALVTLLALVLLVSHSSSSSSSLPSPSTASTTPSSSSFTRFIEDASPSPSPAHEIPRADTTPNKVEEQASGANHSNNNATETDVPSGDDDDSGDDTYDHRFIPTKLPLEYAKRPLCGPEPTCSGNQDISWNGPIAYSGKTYLPPIHHDSSKPRFVHLTDIHLEYAYETGSITEQAALNGVCRRMTPAKGSDKKDKPYEVVDEIDWLVPSSSSNKGLFPLGRVNCDTNAALFQSTLDALASFATPLEHVPRAVRHAEKEKQQRHVRQAKALGAVGHPVESSKVLSVEAALSDKTARPPYDFVLLTGDLVAHYVDNPEIHLQTLRKVIGDSVKILANRVIGGADAFLPAIGNTDLAPSFYIEQTAERLPFVAPGKSEEHSISCHPTFHRLLTEFTSHGLFNDSTAQNQFCQGGYYAKSIPHLNLRVLTLNTIVFAPEYLFAPKNEGEVKQARQNAKLLGPGSVEMLPTFTRSHCEDPKRLDDPFDQFQWLESELSQAGRRGEKVLISGHIPAGFKDHPNQIGWCERYTKKFRDIVAAQPTGLILTQIFGDFSEDEVKFLYNTPEKKVDANPAGEPITVQFDSYNSARFADVHPELSSTAASPISSLFIAPGLSPRKHGNPSFRIWYLEQESKKQMKQEQAQREQEQSTHASADSHADAKPSTGDTTSGSASKAENATSSPSHRAWTSAITELAESIAAPTATAETNSEPTVAYQLSDYAQWLLPLQYANGAALSHQPWNWQYHYSFRNAFNIQDFSASSLAGFYQSLATNPLLMLQYQMHVSADSPTLKSYVDWLCDIRFIDLEANSECKRSGKLGL